ncbi:MAG: PhaM family polyhydroxyalkanoate granule multifunctional regulatory protein [Inhella sp.]
MSDAQFSKFVPGFEFLQGLVKNAGQTLPGIGQWVAPTLNPEELGKRIEELRTVQFWLEQNARMLAATIQALEVQRMTLSTLKTMNVPLGELKEALKVPEFQLPGVPPGVAPVASPAVKATKKVAKTAVRTATAGAKAAGKAAAAGGNGVGVDPMQWWGALTQQFSQVAANAMKDSATDAAKGLAQSLVKQSIDAAGDTLRKAASVPQAVVGGVAGSMAKSLSAQRAERDRQAAKPSQAPAAAPKPAARKRVRR